MEKERLSRLTQLAPLATSYESLSQKQKAEIAASLQTITEDPPVDQHRVDEMPSKPEVDKMPSKLEVDETPSKLEVGEMPSKPETDDPSTQPMCLWRHDESPSVSPRSMTQDESADSTLDGAVSDPKSLTMTTEDSGSPIAQTTEDQIEGSPTYNPGQVSSMLAVLYSSFLANVQRMGVLLSPRTVLPRPEEQDDETKVTQELSQAQRQLVAEEESIWKRVLEVATEERTEEDVSLLARELKGKSAKILTSYERRKSPPPGEVYSQSRIVLQALGVPCIDAEGGIEGEALASAIVRDGFADVVASEDTVGSSSSL